MSDHDTAIRRLINEHQTRLFGFILSICPNRLLAEDVLQESNRVLWEKRSGFEIGTSFMGWAMRIARNQTLAHLKLNRRKHWLLFDTEFVEAVAKRNEKRDEHWEWKLGALRVCLSKLQADEAELIRLRYGSRMRIDEIGYRFEKTTAATKQVLFRIRKKLQNCIERRLNNDNRED